MYLGLNAQTGKKITDMAHIEQSMRDILLTPLGSRIQRRHYGSALFALIDQPNHDATRLRVMSAVVMALSQWEPRVSIQKVDYQHNAERVTLTIDGERSDLPYQKIHSVVTL